MFTKYLGLLWSLCQGFMRTFRNFLIFFALPRIFTRRIIPLRTDLHDKAAQQWTFSLSLRLVQKQNHMRIPTKQKAWEMNETRLRVQKAGRATSLTTAGMEKNEITNHTKRISSASRTIHRTPPAEHNAIHKAQPHSPILRQYRRQCRGAATIESAASSGEVCELRKSPKMTQLTSVTTSQKQRFTIVAVLFIRAAQKFDVPAERDSTTVPSFLYRMQHHNKSKPRAKTSQESRET